jgi:hypothetical protein
LQLGSHLPLSKRRAAMSGIVAAMTRPELRRPSQKIAGQKAEHGTHDRR